MKSLTFARISTVLCILLLLDGCGAGGSTTSASGGTGGTGSPAYAAGQVQGFGSIFVNGVEFETNRAAFTVDGRAGTSQNDLAIGMVVTVKGSFRGATGNAVSVSYHDVIEGYVDDKLNANTLVVMGQTVEVDENTRYQNVSGITNIHVGDIVELSGFVKGPGLVAATFVRSKSTLPVDYEVHGFVSGHDALAKTFAIGNLTVSYAGASAVSGLPAVGVWDGLLVAVKGDSYAPASKTLSATAVAAEDDSVNGASEAEVEGYVTAVQGGNRFMVGAYTIQTDSATRYEDGTPADLGLGAYLEVEGTVAGGVIYAETIEFKNKVRIEASVASVNLSAGTLTFYGLGGLTVSVNARTDYNNARGLADVSVGNFVRVTGRAAGSSPGSVIATLIDWEASAPTPEPKLRGPLTSDPADPFVNVLGVPIDTSGWPDSRFAGTVSGRNAFFATARAFDIVSLNGQESGTTVNWRSISFQQ